MNGFSILFIFANYFDLISQYHRFTSLMNESNCESTVLLLKSVESPIAMDDTTLTSKIEVVCPEPILSKNQQRKKRKAEKWEMVKALRKIKKQEASAAKKELKAMTSTINPNELASEITKNRETEEERLNRKAKERSDYLSLIKNGFGIVIDCAWEDEHTEKPLKSLVQQILFCYGHNKRSSNPCQFYLTGIGPKVKAQLSKSRYEDWMGVQSTELEYCEVIKDKELIYLTSDATDTLETLESHCAYIIGGIVDRNRLKGATYNKATKQGIRVAKLPLKEYCKIKSSPVLTVNHVFEILLRYAETKSWTDAFSIVMPERKVSNNSQPITSTLPVSDEDSCHDAHKDNNSTVNYETDEENVPNNNIDIDIIKDQDYLEESNKLEISAELS